MTQQVRIDRSHKISYPSSPDSRGSARIHYQRRPFYMGRHGSPLSYVMFGLWKKQLEETGIPPSAKDLRPLAEEILSVQMDSEPPPRVSGRTTIAITVLVCICVTAALNFPSTQAASKVDGIALTEYESEVVRGTRITDQLRISLKPDSVSQAQSHAMHTREILRRISEGKPIESIDSKWGLWRQPSLPHQ